MKNFTKRLLTVLIVVLTGGLGVRAQSVAPNFKTFGHRLKNESMQEPRQSITAGRSSELSPEGIKALLESKKQPQGPHSWIPKDGLLFKPNVGQIIGSDNSPQPQIKFEASGGDAHFFFTDKGVSYVFYKVDNEMMTGGLADVSKPEFSKVTSNEVKHIEVKGITYSACRVDMELLGANPSAQVLGDKEAQYYSNYYLGGRVSSAEMVKSYRMLVYKDIYPNIDLVFYGKEKRLKYDFVVRPGGDPKAIRMEYRGADKIESLSSGDMRIITPLGEWIEEKPFSFQEINAKNSEELKRMAGSSDVFTKRIIEGNIVHFDVPNHDPSRLLVIDPNLIWAQYFGGAELDMAFGVSVSKTNETYICGMTGSTAFPVVNALQTSLKGGLDGFILKLDAAGNHTGGWSTYYGGSTGDFADTTLLENQNAAFTYPGGFDACSDIYVSGSGNAFVVGITGSTDITTLNPSQASRGGQFDLFVLKLNSNGTLSYGTYYGGALDDGPGNALPLLTGTMNNPSLALDPFLSAGITADANGNAYVVTGTESTDIPKRNLGFQTSKSGNTDILLARFNTDGSLGWSSYCGGSGNEFGTAITVDHQSHIYFSGGTNSDNLSVLNTAQDSLGGEFDAVWGKVTNTGAKRILSYHGASGIENSIVKSDGIAIDPQGYVLLTGFTTSANTDTMATPGAFQTTFGGVADAFVTKFSPLGGENSKVWSTYIGGSGIEFGYNVKSYPNGNIAVVGQTFSSNFTTAGTPIQSTFGGGTNVGDGFISILNPTGTAQSYATFCGGSGNDLFYSLDVTAEGELYPVGQSGSTNAFLPGPLLKPAPRNSNAGTNDGLFLKFTENAGSITAACTGNFGALKVGISKYKVDLANEYPNTLAALESKYDNYTLTEFTDPDLITAGALANIDVLILPEVEDPSVNFTKFTNLGTRLLTWVSNGGVVVFLGSNDANGGGFENTIFNTNLLAGSYQATGITPLVFTNMNTTTCLTNSIGNTVTLTGDFSTYEITTPGYVNVISADPNSAGGMKALGTGKTFLIGADYSSYTSATAQMLADAVTCVGTVAGRQRMSLEAKVTPVACGTSNTGAIDLSVTNAPQPILYSWSNGSSTQDLSGITFGTYTVTISAGPSGQCNQTATYNVLPCGPAKDNPDCKVAKLNLRALNDASLPVDTNWCINNPPNNVTLTTNDSLKLGTHGTYAVSNIPFSPIDVTQLPSTIDLTTDLIDDTPLVNMGIGFEFTYFGKKYRNLAISDNGYITFNEYDLESTFNSQTIPNVAAPNNLVAINWGLNGFLDGNQNTIGNVMITQLGTAPNRRCIITYSDMRYLDIPNLIDPNTPVSTGTWTGQIILYEGDSIDMHLTQIDAQPDVNVPGYGTFVYPRTMGLENFDGTSAVFINGRNRDKTWSATNEGWRFRPYTPLAQRKYRWFSGIDNATPTLVNGQTGPNYILNPLPSDTTRYIVEISYAPNCVVTDTIRVNVGTGQAPPTINSAATICKGASQTLTLTSFVGTVVRWEQSIDNFVTFTTISNVNTSIIVTPTTTTQYRAVVRQTGGCSAGDILTTPVQITVTIVDAGILSSNQTICVGQQANLVLSGANINVIRWESSTDNFVTATAINNTTTTLNPSPIVNTQYRVIVQGITCPSVRDTSNVISVTISNVVAGTLRVDTLLCHGGPAKLTISGHQGNILRWESSTDNFVTVTSIVNMSTLLNTSPIVSTRYRVVISATPPCTGTENSNNVLVTVNRVDAGTMSGTPATICQGQTANLSLANVSGNIVKWESSTDNFVTITSINNITQVHSQILNVTTRFRAIAQNTGLCSNQDTSNTFEIVVVPFNTGTVGSPATVCESGSAVLTLTGQQGTIVRWESSTDNFVTITTISNTTSSITINPAITTKVRCVIQGIAPCTGTQNTNEVIVTVQKVEAGNLSGGTTVCLGQSTTLSLSGNFGNVLRWESSMDNFSTINTISATTTTLSVTPNMLTQYRVVVQNLSPCTSMDTSNAVSVDVTQFLVGNAGNDTTICNGVSTNINLSGHIGNILRWESSTDNFITINTINSTTSTISVTPGQTTQYRAVVAGNPPCSGQQNSNIVTITVIGVNSGTLSGGTTICSGSSTTLTLSGSIGNVVRWESSTDGFITIGTIATTTTTLSVMPTVNTSYRVVLKSIAPCNLYATSNDVSINVQKFLSGTAGNDTTLCNVGTATINLTGYVGTILRWESSTDNFVTVTTISNLTPVLVVSPVATTKYRAVVQAIAPCSGTLNSNEVTVTFLAVIGGTVNQSVTVCQGSTVGLYLSGQNGNIIRWESSEDNFVTTYPINSTTPLIYVRAFRPTRYRAIVGYPGQCNNTAISTDVIVDLFANGNAGVVSMDQTVCTGSNSGVLSLNGYVGTIVRWESSTNNFSTYTIINNATPVNMYFGLTQTTKFRAIVRVAGCPELISTYATITVNQPPVGGTLQQDMSVCPGSSGTLTLTGYTGNIDSWEISEDGFVTYITDINNTPNYSFSNLTATTQYRVNLSDPYCGFTQSNIVTVSLVNNINPGTLLNSRVVCSVANSGTFQLVGYSGQIIQWESSTDNFATSTVIANTLDSYNYTDITQNTWFRVLIGSEGCGSSYSNIISVKIASPAEPGNLIRLNSSGGNCNLATGTLQISGGSGNIIRWESSTDAGLNWMTISNFTTTYNYNVGGVTHFRVVYQNIPCAPQVSNVVIVSPGLRVVAEAFRECNNVGKIIAQATGGTAPYTYVILPNAGVQNPSGVFKNLIPATYTIVVKDKYNCTAKTTVKIPNVLSAPKITSVQVLDGTRTRISWTDITPGVPNVTYQIRYRVSPLGNWVTKNVGATSYLITGLLPNTTYNFQVRARCLPQPSWSSWTIISSFTTTARGESGFISESNSSISLYPNPAQDQINIKFNFTEEGDYHYELFDTKGSKVADGVLTGTEGTQTVDLSNLTNGVYLYRLKNGIDLISTQKIIIER